MHWGSACPPKTQTILSMYLSASLLMTLTASVDLTSQSMWKRNAWTDNHFAFNLTCEEKKKHQNLSRLINTGCVQPSVLLFLFAFICKLILWKCKHMKVALFCFFPQLSNTNIFMQVPVWRPSRLQLPPHLRSHSLPGNLDGWWAELSPWTQHRFYTG